MTAPLGFVSVNAPSASVRISLPFATTEAPASGCFCASTTRPVTRSGQGSSAAFGVGAVAGAAGVTGVSAGVEAAGAGVSVVVGDAAGIAGVATVAATGCG